MEKGKEQMNGTEMTFKQMKQSIEGVGGNLEGITNYLVHVMSHSTEINHALQEIAAVSEESAATIEESSVTTKKANEAISIITNNAQDLKGLSTKLHELVLQFQITKEKK
ncbi:methyl-accepting chemotaxis protein [Halalkalibacter sp. APA_J-10(15)]|uniref:methyl-accepting chemotaxis protein n=1 Tax=Halalkalibacter sp. APA_J-10(15) TaxID=2933805 RepID=UPI001FF4395D|nr:methyl-accepting chemotaxis protein [Halalkalibacter sp. APA_J-10(15)]MCK0472791.1 methyl-accepting chemotaxis protein [Halalkalibacter sp. APA_J-10(15)]